MNLRLNSGITVILVLTLCFSGSKGHTRAGVDTPDSSTREWHERTPGGGIIHLEFGADPAGDPGDGAGGSDSGVGSESDGDGGTGAGNGSGRHGGRFGEGGSGGSSRAGNRDLSDAEKEEQFVAELTKSVKATCNANNQEIKEHTEPLLQELAVGLAKGRPVVIESGPSRSPFADLGLTLNTGSGGNPLGFQLLNLDHEGLGTVRYESSERTNLNQIRQQFLNSGAQTVQQMTAADIGLYSLKTADQAYSANLK